MPSAHVFRCGEQGRELSDTLRKVAKQTDVVVDRIRRSLHLCDCIRRVYRIRRQTFSGDRVAVDRRRDVHGDGVRDQRNSAI